MSSNILSQLQEFQRKSNNRLNPVVVASIQDHAKPRALVDTVLIANGKFAVKPIKGVSSLAAPNSRQSKRKVCTFMPGNEHITSKLNQDLLGGESYPVLTAVLGIAAGVVSGGAGLLFTIATTGLTLGNTTKRVLARPGDEVWHIEEIGKMGNKPVYISAFFLVDPFRKQAPNKGWLIHEEREELLLN